MLPNSPAATPTRYQKWRRILTQFLVGQVCIQVLNLVTGFLLLRWLSIEDYAQTSVVLAFQSTLASLVDLGFSGCIVALVGERGDDAKRVGSYIRAAIQQRTYLLVIGIAVSSLIFPLLTMRHGWGTLTTVILFGAIAASIAFQTWQVYGVPLLIHGRLQSYYRPQIIAALMRLGICSLLHTFGVFNSSYAAWITVLSIAFTGWSYKRSSKPYIIEPEQAPVEIRKEMFKYLAPLMPGLIFTAAQGQITISIITLFGKTDNIAQVAALGRLGQVFLVLNALNSTIIEPLIARTSIHDLIKRYLTIIAGAAVCVTLICLFSFKFPNVLLWILGPNYHNVGQAVGWSAIAASISYIAGVAWTLNSARKWVFWWYTGLNIGLICFTQIIGVLTLDLSTTLGVMYFAAITSAGSLLSHVICAIYGLSKARRDTQITTERQGTGSANAV